MNASKFKFNEYFLLAFLIACSWVLIWGRGGLDFIHAPVFNWSNGDPYSGDSLGVFSLIKAFAEGDISPFLLKFNDRLNAPFVANWNDYPLESMIYAIPSIFVKIFGFYEGLNIYLMLLHVACGLSFYFVGRSLSYDRSWCFAGAFIFAFSPFLFYRGLSHLTVATVWHLPLLLLTLVWVNAPTRLNLSNKTAWRVSVLTSILVGLFNPYYAAVFLFFLLISLAGKVHSKQINEAKQAAWLIGIVIFAFISQHLDTFIFQMSEGKNSLAIMRNLEGLTIWGLRIPDMIFPPEHRSSMLAWFSASRYYNNIPGFLRGESQLAYIGIISAFGLVLLMVVGTLKVAEKRFDEISYWYWLGLGSLGFSVAGGLNYLAGAIGFVLFRATNRFSIVLMLIGLYFLCELLSGKKMAPRTTWGLAVGAIVFALWDQIPPSKMASRLENRNSLIISDRIFTSKLENSLPPNAMVFQLPVHAFPESGPVIGMSDYEHFRPYLYSKSLRFSYGTQKGRGDSDWQLKIEKMPVETMVANLEKYGFSAILINRNAYSDKAETITSALLAQGYKVVSEEIDLIAFSINANPNPIFPKLKGLVVEYGSDFYPTEIGTTEKWSWAKKSEVTLLLKRPWYPSNYPASGKSADAFNFHVQGLDRCNIWMSENQGQERKILSSNESSAQVSVGNQNTKNINLHFRSDCPVHPPGNGDMRGLAFRIIEPMDQADEF